MYSTHVPGNGASPWFAARRPVALPPLSEPSQHVAMELWHPPLPEPDGSGFPWFG